jgi:hypothetical protein
VGLLTPSHQNEILASRQPLLTIVVVEGHSEQGGRLRLGLTCSHVVSFPRLSSSWAAPHPRWHTATR